MMKRLASIFALILTLAIAGVAQAQGISGTTLDLLNLRSTPSPGDNVIAQLTIGTAVSIQGRNEIGDWLYISANGRAGWVSSRYIDWEGVELANIPISSTSGSTITSTTTLPVTSSLAINSLNASTTARLNVRKTATVLAASRGVLDLGAAINAFGRNRDGTWLAVDTGTVRGWVLASYINLNGDVMNLPQVENVESPPPVPVTTTSNPTTSHPPITNSGGYVITGASANNFSSYDVEITLHWNTTANLDLRVTGPDGYIIMPGIPPSPSGGYFQQAVGANEICANAEGAALEVITWDKGTAPSGNYHITATHVNACFPQEEQKTLFWVSVKNDGPEVEFWVYFIDPGQVYDFDFTRP